MWSKRPPVQFNRREYVVSIIGFIVSFTVALRRSAVHNGGPKTEDQSAVLLRGFSVRRPLTVTDNLHGSGADDR